MNLGCLDDVVIQTSQGSGLGGPSAPLARSHDGGWIRTPPPSSFRDGYPGTYPLPERSSGEGGRRYSDPPGGLVTPTLWGAPKVPLGYPKRGGSQDPQTRVGLGSPKGVPYSHVLEPLIGGAPWGPQGPPFGGYPPPPWGGGWGTHGMGTPGPPKPQKGPQKSLLGPPGPIPPSRGARGFSLGPGVPMGYPPHTVLRG